MHQWSFCVIDHYIILWSAPISVNDSEYRLSTRWCISVVSLWQKCSNNNDRSPRGSLLLKHEYSNSQLSGTSSKHFIFPSRGKSIFQILDKNKSNKCSLSSLYLIVNREGFTKYGEVRVQHSVLHPSDGWHLLFAPHTKNFDCAIFCLSLQSPQVTHNPSGLMDPSLTNVLWPSPQIISNARLTALQIENHRSGLDDWFICKVVNFHKYF